MQTISRSKTVFVSINKIGRNYLPFIKELETYNVKYIDILPSTVYAGGNIIKTVDNYLFLSLADRYGNIFYDNIEIRNFSPGYYLGQRKLIDKRLVLQNCFIENTEEYLIGRFVAITFFWDEESSYSYKVQTNSLADNSCYKELIELLIKPTEGAEKYEVIKFPDIRNIADKRIRAIRPAYEYTSISPLGYKTILNGWNIAGRGSYSIYLTLARGSEIYIDRLNMISLNDGSLLETISFNDIIINFPDSFIEVVMIYDGSEIPTEIRSIPLIIEYLEA